MQCEAQPVRRFCRYCLSSVQLCDKQVSRREAEACTASCRGLTLRLLYAELYANQSVEEQKVKDIMEMGFSREQAQKALDVCGMDKQAAIEHILSNV
jgi:UBA/TS-N domain